MTDESKSTETPSTDAKSEDQLGEGGKKALDSERRGRREAEKALRDAQAERDELRREKLLSEVATSKNLSPDLARRLQGSTKEELETDADDLLAAISPDEKSMSSTGKPKERMRSGSSSDDDEIPDPNKLADRIFDRGI